MNEKLYSLTELTVSIAKAFEISIDDENDKQAIRQKVSRSLKDTGIWDKGIPKQHGERTTMYFTEHQKQELLRDKSMFNYVRDHSQSEEILNSKRFDEIQNAIQERRISHIEYLDSLEKNNEVNNAPAINDPVISERKFWEHKRNMMLTAIFEMYFTPIDDSLLLSDLYRVHITADELHLEVEDIEAEDRLSHPEGYYYRRKERT